MSAFANQTPIIAGFHPDPTLCRRGDEIYLANSSFEYFPAAPLHRSRDLRTWTSVGTIIRRPEQFTLSEGRASGGIYGSTLRWHDGRFWFVTTNLNDYRAGQLIFTAEEPDAWSGPVAVTGALGIDPDLAWGEDGRCYLTWCAPTADGRDVEIAQADVDPATGKLRSSPRRLWSGTGMRNPEGPHLLQRAGWWYLLVAEGGTSYGHSVSIARGRIPQGPFEPCPANPILTHRSTAHPVQCTGHADLLELPDGDWVMVFLGTRPRGGHPHWHTLGRETFLARVEWSEGWPVVREEDLPAPAPQSFVDDFAGPALASRWVTPGGYTATELAGDPVLRTRRGSAADGVYTRVTELEWTATAELDVTQGAVALELRLDDRHWARVEASAEHTTGRLAIGPVECALGEDPGGASPRTVRIRVTDSPDPALPAAGGPDRIHLEVWRADDWHRLGEVDGRYLTTDVAGGFTGRMIGLRPLGGSSRLLHFDYRGR